MTKYAGTVCLAALFLMLSFCVSCTPRVPLAPKESTDNLKDLAIEMVFVKGGCFQMGDNFGDGKGNERPVHEVCLDDFFMGKYVVTQGQWKRIMGTNPSHFMECGDDCPVEKVSWFDVGDFIRKLNDQTGKNYRLPTEAEWEYSARSGGKREEFAGTSRPEELGVYAWYGGNSGERTHPVGQKKPNEFGLFDMSGNVWEWVSDWFGYDYYNHSPRNNPEGPPEGKFKVLRGGSWLTTETYLRASFRDFYHPANRFYHAGFRLAIPTR